jgi:hypothetical protein
MGPVDQLGQWLAPWESLYNDSKAVSTSIMVVHVLGLLWSGGLAIAADRSTLRAIRGTGDERNRQLAELHATHRPVLLGLTAVALSGLFQAAADVRTYAVSPVFWTKMGLIGLLLTNGLILARTEKTLRASEPAGDALWRRLQFNTQFSMALWSLTLIMGVVLVEAA